MGDIMENKPLVFIAYSWEGEKHRQKVDSFADKLQNNGLIVTYDKDAPLGIRLTDFMEENIEKSDFVLCVCTPLYKEKADRGIGGVKYEKNIITAEIYEKGNEQKFIPILFSGTWDESLPMWAKGKLGINYTNESDSEFQRLVSTLTSNKTNELTIKKKTKYKNY